MKLKNKLSNHLKAFEGGIYISVLIIIAVSLIGYINGFNSNLFDFYYVFLALNLIPALYIHLEYYLANFNHKLEIIEGQIILIKNNKLKRYLNSDISDISIFMTKNVFLGSSLRFLAFENYNFARIKIKGENDVIITNLITPDVELAIKNLGFKYQIKTKFFCSLFWG